MQLRFHIPDEEEEQREEDGLPPPEPPGPVELRDVARPVLVAVLGATAMQLIWPLPLVYLTLYSLIGIGGGIGYVLGGGTGAIGGLIVFGLLDVVNPDWAWRGIGSVIAIAALDLGMFIGRWIDQKWGADAD